MFARVMECQVKDGWGAQITIKLTKDVLPVLRVQPGFVDFFALADHTNAEKLVCISFWNSGDAEEFHRQHYETITYMLQALLECPPTLKTFTTGDVCD